MRDLWNLNSERDMAYEFDANYTYSHTIDTATNEFHTSALNPRRAQDTNQLGNDRGDSDLDVPHKFAISLAYNTPKTTIENHFMRALLNSYFFGSSFIAKSGQPVTLQSGVDSNGNDDSAGDRVVFNPAGVGNTGSDVFPVCEGPGGATYIGSTAYTSGGKQWLQRKCYYAFRRRSGDWLHSGKSERQVYSRWRRRAHHGRPQ